MSVDCSLWRFHSLGTLVYDSLKTKIAIIQGSDYGLDVVKKLRRQNKEDWNCTGADRDFLLNVKIENCRTVRSLLIGFG